MWRSLVARVVRDDEVAGSNPVTPTNEKIPPFMGGIFSFVATGFVITAKQVGPPVREVGCVEAQLRLVPTSSRGDKSVTPR